MAYHDAFDEDPDASKKLDIAGQPGTAAAGACWRGKNLQGAPRRQVVRRAARRQLPRAAGAPRAKTAARLRSALARALACAAGRHRALMEFVFEVVVAS